MYSIYKVPFLSDDHLPTLRRGRQTNLLHGNFNELQMAVLAVQKGKKQAITRERKLFSEIHQLKTFGVQQRPD